MKKRKIAPPTECHCIELQENGGVAFPAVYRSFKRFYFAHEGLDESNAFHWCRVCGRLWNEWDSPTFPGDERTFWEMSWEDVLKQKGDRLPEDFPTDYDHFVRWVEKGGEFTHQMFSNPVYRGVHPSEC